MSSWWERAWDDFVLTDDAIDIGIEANRIMREDYQIAPEAADTKAAAKEEHEGVVHADVQHVVDIGPDMVMTLRFPPILRAKLRTAADHIDEHECEWGMTVVMDLVDAIVMRFALHDGFLGDNFDVEDEPEQ